MQPDGVLTSLPPTQVGRWPQFGWELGVVGMPNQERARPSALASCWMSRL
jgi:hypothetical protein